MTNAKATPNAVLDDELIRWLADQPYDRDEFVIVGSAPLLAHGILRGPLRDLDVVACGATWRLVRSTGEPETGTITGAPMASFYHGRVHFSAEWFGPRSTRELIERADIISGLRFASVPDVREYKLALKRAKDMDHVGLIDQWRGQKERFPKSRSIFPGWSFKTPVFAP